MIHGWECFFFFFKGECSLWLNSCFMFSEMKSVGGAADSGMVWGQDLRGLLVGHLSEKTHVFGYLQRPKILLI